MLWMKGIPWDCSATKMLNISVANFEIFLNQFREDFLKMLTKDLQPVADAISQNVC